MTIAEHGAAAEMAASRGARFIENKTNAGFGRAVNQGIELSEGEFICTLNDDAYPAPEWLENLVAACEKQGRVGMCASQILLRHQPGCLDSAGLNIYGDGTTKQRGRRGPGHPAGEPSEALIPSGCAALYRRSMLDQIGLFDGDYFLYCEDTDLGLQGRLAGWNCLYVPGAVVEHDYSSHRRTRIRAEGLFRGAQSPLHGREAVPGFLMAPGPLVFRLAIRRASLGDAPGTGLGFRIRRRRGKVVASCDNSIVCSLERPTPRSQAAAQTPLGPAHRCPRRVVFLAAPEAALTKEAEIAAQ